MVELLLVIVVVAVLATAAMAAAWKLRELAAERLEMGRYRRLGQGILGWAGEHSGRLPRSSHSAFANGELGWRREILPMLGHADTSAATFQRVAVEEFGIVSTGTAPRGPALNVYFELDPASDDYDGSPATWRQLAVIPNPASTVLLTAAPGHPGAPMADHVMAHYFAGKAETYPARADGRPAGVVLWVDGHVTVEKPGSLFDQANGIDRFHPEKSATN
jgi:prepilin-type processing-associated H-X9-DG protein